MAEIDPNKFVEQELAVIKYMFSQQKEIYPMVTLIEGDKRFPIPLHYRDDEQKDIVSIGIKNLVKERKPDAVVYIAEAWAVIIKDKTDRLDFIPRPTYHPDRIEQVIAQIEFKTGEKFGCYANIIRDGPIPRLEKFVTNDYSRNMSMGRFCDFFPIKQHN